MGMQVPRGCQGAGIDPGLTSLSWDKGVMCLQAWCPLLPIYEVYVAPVDAEGHPWLGFWVRASRGSVAETPVGLSVSLMGVSARVLVCVQFSLHPALHHELYLPNLLSCLQRLWCFSPFSSKVRTSASLSPRNPF